MDVHDFYVCVCVFFWKGREGVEEGGEEEGGGERKIGFLCVFIYLIFIYLFFFFKTMIRRIFLFYFAFFLVEMGFAMLPRLVTNS